MNYIYNISINVTFAIKYKLDFMHCSLIEFFLLLPTWSHKMEYEGDIYYRANMKKIHEQLPMLSAKDDTVYRYVKKLIDLGFIKKVKGLDYYKTNDCLLEYKGIKHKSDSSEEYPEKVSDTDPIYNSTIGINNITEDAFLQKQKEKEEYIQKRKEHLTNAFEYWNSITHIKKGKGLPKCTKITKDIEESRNKLYDRYPKEDIAKSFDRYISEIEGRIDNGGTYYSHRFSFYEFISRSTGLKKFINS